MTVSVIERGKLPLNAWLAHVFAQRLEAEAIRDTEGVAAVDAALAKEGLRVEKHEMGSRVVAL